MAQKIKILFLAANPIDTKKLQLNAEFREIDLALQTSEYRDFFELKEQSVTRVSDLQPLLMRYRPDIVHFSGHGSENSEIILEDNAGTARVVPQKALGRLFKLFKKQVRCVVLNACFSQKQAQAIAEHVDCVVGMSRAISDDAAVKFSLAYYRALGYGNNIQFAFDAGCNEIDLEGLNEQDTPKLLFKKVRPDQIIFIHYDTAAEKPINQAPVIDPSKLLVVGTFCLVLVILVSGLMYSAITNPGNSQADVALLGKPLGIAFGLAILALVAILYLIIKPSHTIRTTQ